MPVVRLSNMRYAAAVQVLVLVVAPGLLVGQVQQEASEVATAAFRALDTAEKRWHRAKPAEYEFSIEVRCFCVGIVSPPPRFRVIGDKPTALPPVPPRASETYDHFNTIDKLFVRIRETIQRGQHKAVVSYDDNLGYPVVADLDPRDRVFDDELFFRVHNFSER
jgi:hypothetical protein